MTYAFAAAGTGGHIYPALAVARTLVESGVDAGDIVFFGGDRLETRIVPAAGFELVQLDVHGLKRSLTVDNLTIPMMVRRAAAVVAGTLKKRPPGVLTVFGGYVSVPAAMGARKAGMPYVIHEQNAVPGVANRYVARRARRTYVAFAPALARFEDAELVGNPLAPAFESFDRSTIRSRAFARYGLDPDRPVVGVFGGSLGAQALNSAAVSLAAAADRPFSILHLTGADHHAALAEQSADSAHWVTKPFEQDMEMFYAGIGRRAVPGRSNDRERTGGDVDAVGRRATPGREGVSSHERIRPRTGRRGDHHRTGTHRNRARSPRVARSGSRSALHDARRGPVGRTAGSRTADRNRPQGDRR